MLPFFIAIFREDPWALKTQNDDLCSGQNFKNLLSEDDSHWPNSHMQCMQAEKQKNSLQWERRIKFWKPMRPEASHHHLWAELEAKSNSNQDGYWRHGIRQGYMDGLNSIYFTMTYVSHPKFKFVERLCLCESLFPMIHGSQTSKPREGCFTYVRTVEILHLQHPPQVRHMTAT